MKPNQLKIHFDPVTGAILAVHKPHAGSPKVIRDITLDVLTVLCAQDTTIDPNDPEDQWRPQERTLRFSDDTVFHIKSQLMTNDQLKALRAEQGIPYEFDTEYHPGSSHRVPDPE